MTLALWFWVIYVVALLFYGFMGYRSGPNREFYINNLVLWLLLALLGAGTFGSPIK